GLREFAVITRVIEDTVAVPLQKRRLRFRHGIFPAALLVSFVNEQNAHDVTIQTAVPSREHRSPRPAPRLARHPKPRARRQQARLSTQTSSPAKCPLLRPTPRSQAYFRSRAPAQSTAMLPRMRAPFHRLP